MTKYRVNIEVFISMVTVNKRLARLDTKPTHSAQTVWVGNSKLQNRGHQLMGYLCVFLYGKHTF